MERVTRIQLFLRILCVALGVVALAVVLWNGSLGPLGTETGVRQIAARSTSAAHMTNPVTLHPFADLVGTWKLDGAAGCKSVYRIAVQGNDRLTFTGPDGTAQREKILGMENDWLHTTSGEAASFYKLAGKHLVYRYGSEENARSETTFVRCG